MKTLKLSEGWVKFIRIFCLKGYIDKWVGDTINNPNNEDINNVQLNSMSIFYRLNNKTKWINEHEFNKLNNLIISFNKSKSANDIWNLALKNPNKF